VPITFTPLMEKRLTRRAQEMIERTLPYFPELIGKTITVGYTRKHLGSATIIYDQRTVSRLIIRLKVRKVTYQTIGHELTHLVQGLSRGDRCSHSSLDAKHIPSGEKQCDIWTLARDPLFCDDPPTYLRLPRAMREHWTDYAKEVRELCIVAIEKRNKFRLYIRWLEAEIRKLAKTPLPKKSEPKQLSLPFSDEGDVSQNGRELRWRENPLR
jgi:hypothetical protein